MPIQHRRTRIPNLAPTGLLPGQLAVEMASEPIRLWTGVPTTIDPSGRREVGGAKALPPALLAGQSMLRGNRVNTTTYNFSVAQLIVRDPVADDARIVDGTAGLQCNVNIAGLNGRDQAAAFSNNTWIHFYWIYNPNTDTLATIASTRLPSAGGPSPLPAEFTHWCYIGPIRRSPAILLRMRINDDTFFYIEGNDNVVLAAGNSWSVHSSFSVANFVPINANDYDMLIQLMSTDTMQGTNQSLYIEPVPADLEVNQFLTYGQSPKMAVTNVATFPNVIPQTLYYADPTSIGLGNFGCWVTAYSVPNGAI